MKVYSQYHWPGNVRELENMIQRFVVLGDEKPIIEELSLLMKPDTVPKENIIVPNKKAWPSLRKVHQEAALRAESELIVKALEMTNWNRKKAANILNISYKTLLNKIKECGLDKRFVPLRF